MADYTVTVTDEEDIALKAQLLDVQKWIQDAIKNKASNCMNRAILKTTNLNPDRLTEQEKETVVRDNKEALKPRSLRDGEEEVVRI